jgi:hypothetical protein
VARLTPIITAKFKTSATMAMLVSASAYGRNGRRSPMVVPATVT